MVHFEQTQTWCLSARMVFILTIVNHLFQSVSEPRTHHTSISDVPERGIGFRNPSLYIQIYRYILREMDHNTLRTKTVCD
jgi:hypothetical protein